MNTNERGTVDLFRQLIRRLEDRLFAPDDDWARRRGLQISRGRNGHGRRYRDPRWDLVAECSSCGGTGAAGAARCRECEGRGTVRLDRLGAGTKELR